MSPLVLTTEEAAEQVGVSPATIRSWVLRGHLEPLMRGVHPLRFDWLDVARCHADRKPQAYHDTLRRKWAACIRADEMQRSGLQDECAQIQPRP